MPYATTPLATERMPPGVPYIVVNEAAERFSFYGMRAVLYVFMTKYLCDASGRLAVMDEHTAVKWQHWFLTAVYFLPIFGALISDVLWGKYKTIIRISAAYCVGHVLLALVDLPKVTGIDPRHMLIAALALLAVGAGGFKPCVSAHVGDQFSPRNKHLIERVFQWFYFSTNLGGGLSMILTPRLLSHYGPWAAFGTPGVFMALSTLTFWLGRYKFAHVPPVGRRIFSEIASRDSRRAMINLAPLYAFGAMFWCLFDQTQSKWVEQAKHMNRVFFGFEFDESEMQAANSIFILILIPVFANLIFPAVQRFVPLTPLRKVGAGLFVTAAAFALCALVQMWIDGGAKPHIGWQVLAYLIITSGEVLVAVTTYEFTYTQAPRALKSYFMSLFMLSIAAGNLLTASVNGRIAQLETSGYAFLSGANYYWTFTGAMLAAAMAFVVWSQFYKGETFIQGEEAASAKAAS